MKIDWFDSEIYIFFTDESVKRQITDSISENLTDSDLESSKYETSPKSFLIKWSQFMCLLRLDVLENLLKMSLQCAY